MEEVKYIPGDLVINVGFLLWEFNIRIRTKKK